MKLKRRFTQNLSGAASMEYAALIALLAAVLAGGTGSAGMGMAKKFGAIAQTLEGPPSSPALGRGPTAPPPTPK